MTRIAASPILHLIRRVVEDRRLKDLPDQELLCRFLTGRDKGAFDALLRRHGSMVLDVCRNVLGNEQDAEDAFQATFLVLAQKAGAIRQKSSVGSWLYGVAYRTASKVRLRSARRQKHEAACSRRNIALAHDDLTWLEVQRLLHAELNRLPELYRASLVYCYLEGKTQDEAAQLLGISRATVKKRLEAGRALLRTRLVRHGLGPAAVLAVSAWPAATASAVVPLVLLDSTSKAATLIGAGAPAGLISPRVVALTEGVLKAMFLTKLKIVSAVALTILVGTGLAGWSYRVTAAQPDPSPQAQTGQPDPRAREERPPLQMRRGQGATADELDALRLEIEALRKDFKVMRERVKALEAQVAGRNASGAGAKGLNNLERNRLPMSANLEVDVTDLNVTNGRPIDLAYPPVEKRLRVVLDADYLAEAEAALKRLRQNPHDNQAAELLERASQRLKARAKGEGKPDNASNNAPPRQQ